MKARLKKWNSNSCGKVDVKVQRLREQMYKIQEARRLCRDDVNLAAQEKEITVEYLKTLKLEESFFRQKSRVQWLELGSNDNKFFHRSIIVRRSKTQISHLLINEGKILDDKEEIRKEVE